MTVNRYFYAEISNYQQQTRSRTRVDLGGGGEGVAPPFFQSGPPFSKWFPPFFETLIMPMDTILILSNDLFFYNVVVRYVFCQYSYTKLPKNTDFGVLQKSSKHFLISIFFHHLLSACPPPPSK